MDGVPACFRIVPALEHNLFIFSEKYLQFEAGGGWDTPRLNPPEKEATYHVRI